MAPFGCAEESRGRRAGQSICARNLLWLVRANIRHAGVAFRHGAGVPRQGSTTAPEHGSASGQQRYHRGRADGASQERVQSALLAAVTALSLDGASPEAAQPFRSQAALVRSGHLHEPRRAGGGRRHRERQDRPRPGHALGGSSVGPPRNPHGELAEAAAAALPSGAKKSQAQSQPQPQSTKTSSPSSSEHE